MNKKLLYIPPISHLYNLPNFIKNNKISLTTKMSVLFENIFLYFFAGVMSGVSSLSINLFIIVLLLALLSTPFEWKIINFIKTKIKKSLTNWENFNNKKSYYFLQYQLMGYIVIGYMIGRLIILL